jgi:hypothetical protein
MQLTAKITQLLPLQTGMGKSGQWRKQDIIVETDGQYPKNICISIWGDKINENQLQIGNSLTISYELESREYNNKWYTDVRASKLDLINTPISTSPTNTAENTVNLEEEEEDQDDEDLPF